MDWLILDNLSKTYRTRGVHPVHGVKDLSISVSQGQRVAITGESGSGKTTLLMLIAGLLQPDSGSIMLAGRDLDNVRPDHRRIAIVFQHDALYPHLSAKHLALAMRGADRATIRKTIDRVADELGITECLERRPGAMSGGQRRRVALARAIVRDADLVLLDEPFTGIDDDRRTQIHEILKDQWDRSGSTVLFVTHDTADAADLSDRVVHMKRGQIDADNTR